MKTMQHESKRFKQWMDDGNVIQTSAGKYKTQCSLYRKEFTYDELKKYFRHEYRKQ